MTNNEKVKGIITKIIFVIVVLVAWEVTARAGVFGEKSEIVFPTSLKFF